jgi:glycosyltransferase involved in cell wall biosynthesis/GT2 family glycosyltransferase
MHIGFIEPHLRRYGGIRRVLELSNRLVDAGHEVTIYVEEGSDPRCTWMECRARVKQLPDGLEDELGAVIFNHEPHWYLAQLFERADRRVFYALHAGSLYHKQGSWEATRAPVELRLANSEWTAEMITAECGSRPTVLLGGVNRAHFRPISVPKRYPILCVGDPRPWKGTATIVRAAQLLGLPLERYIDKDLPQGAMAAEYSAAEVFVVGSEFEGFGQPGLEALACGVPLVTTDTGGSREYAIHEGTALVVPSGDADAMADAIARLREDAELRDRLVSNGLDLVAERFDWDRSARDLVGLLEEAPRRAPGARTSVGQTFVGPDNEPKLSVVVLAWDQLMYTQRCVETVRRMTDVSYELVIVDNGSKWEARSYAQLAADVPILNGRNLGFARGMNQGLNAARGEYVVFLNNDTELPPAWASRLIESHEKFDDSGITVPAVTEARNGRTVRESPGDVVEVLDPFEPPPAAVVYFMETATARALEGWGEEFAIASGEDVDLAFKVWVNDLEIVYDQRVLVEHVGKGTAAAKLPNWRDVWARNGRLFLEKWSADEITVPRLESCDRARWERNVRTARAVSGWMSRYFNLRESRFPGQRYLRRAAALPRRFVRPGLVRLLSGRVWRTVRPLVPERLRQRYAGRSRRAVDRYLQGRV